MAEISEEEYMEEEDVQSEVFELKLKPDDKITFDVPEPDMLYVTVMLEVNNPTTDYVAFKVRCTSNDYFRISPPTGVLRPSQTEQVELTYCPGAYRPTLFSKPMHFFAVMYMKLKTPYAKISFEQRNLFKDADNVNGYRWLRVVVNKEEELSSLSEPSSEEMETDSVSDTDSEVSAKDMEEKVEVKVEEKMEGSE